ncbi:ribonuclease H isoform X2 [Drosophila willistoni]|uniref:ribonuclease H isoform X2 n=1 Tax=Drosophila willistoni TaxID=7260 RepID=UPI001F0790DB|nr:ribonuclease H isoform X2 [Drosophila willistoni]
MMFLLRSAVNGISSGVRIQIYKQTATMAYYAVAKGHQVGIFDTWSKCEEQVKGFKGAVYKKFKSRPEAEDFIGAKASSSSRANYKPQEMAVPLGQKEPPPKQWNKKTENKTSAKVDWPDEELEDHWAKMMDQLEGSGGTASNSEHEELITEDDLIAVMNEVEGIPSRKRKIDNDGPSTSKLPRHSSQVLEAVGRKHIGQFEFEIDAQGFVIVYTDGSCLGNGRKDACAGFGVYFGDNHKLNAGKPVLGRVTNNVGEIQAAIYAIKIAKDLGIEKLCICTDSQFLINSITLWVKGWKRRGWRLANSQPVKNVADFKELDELLETGDVQVCWQYVEAHKGIHGNEMADKLARQGSALYRQLSQK